MSVTHSTGLRRVTVDRCNPPNPRNPPYRGLRVLGLRSNCLTRAPVRLGYRANELAANSDGMFLASGPRGNP